MLVPERVIIDTGPHRNEGETLEITIELFNWLIPHVELCRIANCAECRLFGRISRMLVQVYYGDGYNAGCGLPGCKCAR